MRVYAGIPVFVHKACNWFTSKTEDFLRNISGIVPFLLSKEEITARNSREETAFRSFQAFDGLVEMDKLPLFS